MNTVWGIISQKDKNLSYKFNRITNRQIWKKLIQTVKIMAIQTLIGLRLTISLKIHH